MPGWANSTRRATLPPGWTSRIQPAIIRRDPTCMICHAAPSTDADHKGDRNDHRPENLQGLCHPCHVRKTLAEREAARPRRQRNQEQHPGML